MPQVGQASEEGEFIMRWYESEVDDYNEGMVPIVLTVIALVLFIFGIYMLYTL